MTVCGSEYHIRSDYRAVLDICTALTDPELSDQERAAVVLDIFYPEFEDMPQEHYEEAIKKCFWFINCGEEEVAQQSSGHWGGGGRVGVGSSLRWFFQRKEKQ